MEDSKSLILAPGGAGGGEQLAAIERVLAEVERALVYEKEALEAEVAELRDELASARAELKERRELLVEASIKTKDLEFLRSQAPCPVDEKGQRTSLFIIKYYELEMLRQREGNLIGGFGPGVKL